MKRIIQILALFISTSLNAQTYKYSYSIESKIFSIQFDTIPADSKWSVTLSTKEAKGKEAKDKDFASISDTLAGFFTAENFINKILTIHKEKKMRSGLSKKCRFLINDDLEDIYNQFWSENKKKKAALIKEKNRKEEQEEKSENPITPTKITTLASIPDTLISQLVTETRSFVVFIIKKEKKLKLEICADNIDQTTLGPCHFMIIYRSISNDDFVLQFKRVLFQHYSKGWKAPASLTKKISQIYTEMQENKYLAN